jgi:MYXO-CTERM domain-containing protein
MTRTIIRNALLASFAFVAVPAAAQETNTDTGTTYETENDDDGFDWGLLGLLGLAGLLGLRKKDDDHDINVDSRRNTTR